jgi:hypothetical protein
MTPDDWVNAVLGLLSAAVVGAAYVSDQRFKKARRLARRVTENGSDQP